MRISEILPHLAAVRDEHGDLELLIPDRGCGCCGYEDSDIEDIHIANYGAQAQYVRLSDQRITRRERAEAAAITSVLHPGDNRISEESQ